MVQVKEIDDQIVVKIDGIEEKIIIKNIKDTEEVDRILENRKLNNIEEGTDEKEEKAKKP